MTFGVPLFLLAALAGAIPILLHMINRQQATAFPFSTLRFLRISVQKTRRRKYLHDVLLLALRVAALVLLALALARPAVNRLHGWLGQDATNAVAIVLDNSASMAATDQSGTRWARATAAAEQILATLQQGDQVALLVTNGPAVVPSRSLLQNHEIARQGLAICRPSYQRADLPARLVEAAKLLEKSPLPDREIYVITDRQAVSWRDLKSQQTPPSTTDVKQPPVILVDVSGPRESNCALADLSLRATAPVASLPIQVTTKIQGDADVAVQRRVELYVNDIKQAASPTLNIEPGQIAEYTFELVLTQQGIHRGEVRLDGKDACAADDRLYFAVTLDPAIPVAVVTDQPQEIPVLDQSFYLRQALAATGGTQGAIDVQQFTRAGLDGTNLDPFVAIFCVNLPTLAESTAAKLARYAQQGGNLVWICGDNVDPVSCSALNDQVGGGLLPIRLTGTARMGPDTPDAWRIGWLDPEDPLVAPFCEPPSLYQSVLVYTYVQMPPLTGTAVRTIAKLDNGQPLIVSRNSGRGKLLLMATSVHVQWTNLPLRPIFLPLVARVVFQLAGTSLTRPALVAGSRWRLGRTDRTDTSVEIICPNGDAVRLQPRPEPPADGGFRFDNTHQIGVYQVRARRAGTDSASAFAVNPDPDEAAPGRVQATDLESRLGEHQPFFYCPTPDGLPETITRLRQGRSLWEPFLLVVLCALIAEAFVANTSARRETKQQAAAGQ